MKPIIFIFLLMVTNLGFASASSPMLHVTTEGLDLIITPKKNTNYPIAGIKILTPGVTISSGCVRQYNGYCIFNISQTTPKRLTLSHLGTVNYILCLNAVDQLQCQYYRSTLADAFSIIYVANSASPGNIESCALLNGNIATSSCTVSGSNYFDNNDPTYISINKKASKMYVGTYQNTLYTCSINNGLITSNCGSTNTNSQVGGVVYSEKFNKLYYANTFDNEIWECNLDSNGIILSCPTHITVPGSNPQPTALAINNTTNQMYISSVSGSVYHCPLTNGHIGSCSQLAIPSFTDANGLAVNESDNKLYISSTTANGGTVYTCSLSVNGTISGICTSSTGFTSARGIAVNTAANRLYVALDTDDPNGSVFTCTLNLGIIDTNSCTSTTSLGVTPIGVTLN